MIFQIMSSVDHTALLNEYTNIEKDIQWSEYPNGKQAGLQYLYSDPWNDAVGRMKPSDDWSKCILNPFFKNTVFEEIINEFGLKRTRLMWLKPRSCYSMHRDDSPRLHIPLITNEQCFFVFKDYGLFEMPIGNAYKVDTRETHSAMNCSTEWRLHLIGAFQ